MFFNPVGLVVGLDINLVYREQHGYVRVCVCTVDLGNFACFI